MDNNLAILIRKFNNGTEAEMASELLKTNGIKALIQATSAIGPIADYKSQALWGGIHEWGCLC